MLFTVCAYCSLNAWGCFLLSCHAWYITYIYILSRLILWDGLLFSVYSTFYADIIKFSSTHIFILVSCLLILYTFSVSLSPFTLYCLYHIIIPGTFVFGFPSHIVNLIYSIIIVLFHFHFFHPYFRSNNPHDVLSYQHFHSIISVFSHIVRFSKLNYSFY